MKYFILNGSPKGKKSVTMIVTESFIRGICSVDSCAELYYAHLSELDIKPCRSCYACWSHVSAGQCIVTRRGLDDMSLLMKKYCEAEKIIISTPMHFFNISSYLQKFFERTLPLIKQHYIPSTNEKLCNQDMSFKDSAVIVTCKQSFPGIWNCIDEQMKLLSRGRYQALFSTQPLPNSIEGETVVKDYLKLVYEAGKQFALSGIFSDELRKKLKRKSDEMSQIIYTCNLGL